MSKCNETGNEQCHDATKKILNEHFQDAAKVRISIFKMQQKGKHEQIQDYILTFKMEGSSGGPNSTFWVVPLSPPSWGLHLLV